MKKTFQKTLIAAAAGVALMSAVGTASANSLLFPYFTTVTGAQSVLTLSNAGTTPATEALHYVYNYGSSCVHYDASGSMTANDVLSHSVASTTAGGFGKTVSSDTSTPVYFPLSGQTGFVVVSSKTTASTDALRGSMAIIDTAASGLVVSYAGIDNALATNAALEGNFAAITDVNFPLVSLPSGLVTTSWFTVVVGDMNAAIAAGANWDGKVTFSNNGNVYNNDEVAYSGTTTKAVTCQGSITSGDLMTAAQAASVGTNGSLVKTRGTTTAPTLGTTTGAVLMKMQTVLPAAGVYGNRMLQHREQAGL